MKTLLALLASCLTAGAVDLLIIWDANPPSQSVTGYNVFELTGTNWTRIGGSPTNGFRWSNVGPGVHQVSVTATNAFGESPKTTPVLSPYVPDPLTAPSNVTIRAVIQSSTSVTGPWRDLATNEITIQNNGSTEFFRTLASIRKD